MTLRYASPIDASAYGVHRSPQGDPSAGPFAGRLTADGSSGFAAAPGRYHLYAGKFCPWSHRVVLQLALSGLEDVVSVGYVDGLRDGRGWAFRERNGPDDVNGFTLLREAYEATDAGYDGPVRLPVLWDRHTGRIVSDDYRQIGIDIATEFDRWADPGLRTYPERLRSRIEELDRWLGPAVNHGVGRAVGGPEAAGALVAAFKMLDRRLAAKRYLLGDALTEADVRLWVTLVRYDVGPNAHGNVGPRLERFAHLWAYARDLYGIPAFRRTTDFASFAAPFAAIPDWDEPTGRSALSGPGHEVEALGAWSVLPAQARRAS
jgi:putative glutathione S-transferase